MSRRLRHRWFHRLDVFSADLGRSRSAQCRRCGRWFQQRRGTFNADRNPWIDETPVPCTHGTDGRSIPACNPCALDRERRGLVH